MQKLPKLAFLLAALAGTCSAAPTGRAPRALKARGDNQYFLLTPVPKPESLAESAQNINAWYSNKTYLDINGNLTINESEAVRFTFIGSDNEKLELVAQNNRTLAIGVDASLFDDQPFQPFHPLVYSGTQLGARDIPNFQSAEEKYVKTCNGTPGSAECLKCRDDLQVTEGFFFQRADLFESMKPRNAMGDYAQGRVRTNPTTRIGACLNEHCPGWKNKVFSAREGIKDSGLDAHTANVVNCTTRADCHEKCDAECIAYGDSWGQMRGLSPSQCTCYDSNGPIPNYRRDEYGLLNETETQFDPLWMALDGIDDTIDEIYYLDWHDDFDEDDDPDSGFDPLLTLEWFNDKFMVIEDGLVVSSTAGFCVVGLGRPGSQVGVLSPIADPEVEVGCVEVTLYPTFINMLGV